MTQFLPPNLLALFAPREPVPYLPPTDKLTHEKKRQPYSGISEFLDYFEDPEETPAPVHVETKAERIERKIREKAEQVAYKLEQDLALWDPQHNDSATSDPYKTLFVGRINYYTSETKLKREFEAYGKVKQIKIVHDSNTGKSRGYAFIEFEDESAAYKRADGKKIDDRRVVVDIERGRTIEGWKPRRLGGGKGGIRRMALNNGSNNNNNNETIRDDFDTAPAIVSTSKLSKSDRGDRRSKERDRERKRSRDKRSRSRSRDRKRRSRSKDRQRSKSRERSKKSRRSKSKEKDRSHKKRSKSRDRSSKHVPQVFDDHQMMTDNYNEDNNNNNSNNGY